MIFEQKIYSGETTRLKEEKEKSLEIYIFIKIRLRFSQFRNRDQN